MASSEQSRSDLLGRPLTVRRVESVDATATVRHVDQLDADELDAFVGLVENDRPTVAGDVSLEEGEVIVFTDYYRVTGV